MTFVDGHTPWNKIETDICGVEGCDRPRRRLKSGSRKRYCGAHCLRLAKHGDVLAHIPIRAKGPKGSISVGPGGYLVCRRPEHPLAGKGGRLYVHRMVMFDAIGPGTHPCHWCGKPVEWEIDARRGGLQVDHLDGDRANNALTNLVPSCLPCNLARRTAGNPIEFGIRAR